MVLKYHRHVGKRERLRNLNRHTSASKTRNYEVGKSKNGTELAFLSDTLATCSPCVRQLRAGIERTLSANYSLKSDLVELFDRCCTFKFRKQIYSEMRKRFLVFVPGGLIKRVDPGIAAKTYVDLMQYKRQFNYHSRLLRLTKRFSSGVIPNSKPLTELEVEFENAKKRDRQIIAHQIRYHIRIPKFEFPKRKIVSSKFVRQREIQTSRNDFTRDQIQEMELLRESNTIQDLFGVSESFVPWDELPKVVRKKYGSKDSYLSQHTKSVQRTSEDLRKELLKQGIEPNPGPPKLERPEFSLLKCTHVNELSQDFEISGYFFTRICMPYNYICVRNVPSCLRSFVSFFENNVQIIERRLDDYRRQMWWHLFMLNLRAHNPVSWVRRFIGYTVWRPCDYSVVGGNEISVIRMLCGDFDLYRYHITSVVTEIPTTDYRLPSHTQVAIMSNPVFVRFTLQRLRVDQGAVSLVDIVSPDQDVLELNPRTHAKYFNIRLVYDSFIVYDSRGPREQVQSILTKLSRNFSVNIGLNSYRTTEEYRPMVYALVSRDYSDEARSDPSNQCGSRLAHCGSLGMMWAIFRSKYVCLLMIYASLCVIMYKSGRRHLFQRLFRNVQYGILLQ